MSYRLSVIRNAHPRKAAIVLSALMAVGCAIDTDFQQLFAEQDSIIVIEQRGSENDMAVSQPDIELNPPQNPAFDAEKLSSTPSVSVAAGKESRDETKATPTLSALEKAQQQLIRYLDAVETQPERITQIWIDAEQLAQRFPEDKFLQSIWQRLSRYSDWQPVNSIIGSGGIDIASFTGWHPETPALRVRKALLPPMQENEQVILGDQRLVLLMAGKESTTLNVEVRLDDIPFLPQMPALLSYQVDEAPAERILLNANEDWRQLDFVVPPGEHALRFYLDKPIANQFIKLRFDERGGQIGVTQERPYFISTQDTPLSFYCQGPSQIRIDELRDGNITYGYRNIPEGWHTIRLLPPDGRARALFRVSQRTLNLNPKQPNIRTAQRELATVPVPELPAKTRPTNEKVELSDAFKLGKQQDGTLSVGSDVVRRNNKQESGINLPEEQFMQARINYRYFDEPKDLYLNTGAFARHREFGGPTFGLDESIYYNPEWLPFNVSGGAKVNVQAQEEHTEALAQINMTLSQAYNVLPTVRLIPSTTFFARTLSQDEESLKDQDDAGKKEIDQDVYTPYKAQHKAGFNAGLTLQTKPWLDTLIWARTALGSNESFSVSHPDHYNSEAHWQQMVGSIALDASYRVAFYQRDADRSAPQTRSYAGLEANWQHWLLNQQRFEVSAQYNYDIERKAHLATLSLTWHLGEGRGLRDFSPNEIDFRDIRQRQSVDGLNNSMRNNGYCLPPCLEP